jgi:hypothetical protein
LAGLQGLSDHGFLVNLATMSLPPNNGVKVVSLTPADATGGCRSCGKKANRFQKGGNRLSAKKADLQKTQKMPQKTAFLVLAE